MTFELIDHAVLDKILVQISLARSQRIDDEAHNMLNTAQLLILENRIKLEPECFGNCKYERACWSGCKSKAGCLNVTEIVKEKV
jgi:hypothetical protein